MSENYSCREALTVLHAYGFTEERIKKHRILRHPEFNGSVTLPSNPAKPLSPLVLGNIKRLTGMTLQQLTSESQRRRMERVAAVRIAKNIREIADKAAMDDVWLKAALVAAVPVPQPSTPPEVCEDSMNVTDEQFAELLRAIKPADTVSLFDGLNRFLNSIVDDRLALANARDAREQAEFSALEKDETIARLQREKEELERVRASLESRLEAARNTEAARTGQTVSAGRFSLIDMPTQRPNRGYKRPTHTFTTDDLRDYLHRRRHGGLFHTKTAKTAADKRKALRDVAIYGRLVKTMRLTLVQLDAAPVEKIVEAWEARYS